MAPGSWQPMFLNHPDFPVTILEILAKQRAEIGAWMIPTANTRRVPNPAAATAQAQVELVVLITHERFVEHAQPGEDLAAVKSAEHGVGFAFVGNVMPARAAAGKAAMMG